MASEGSLVATVRNPSVSHLTKTSRRLILTVLVAMAFGSLAMRYPTGHEVGVDSFAIHTMAESIVVTGDAAWILNPLSYFGLYPVSYPSAGPFLLASLSLTTGIEIEGSILVSSLLLGVAGILTSYIMAREFRRSGSFALTVAFVYAFAPRFLASNLWQASTRNLFMALLPLFVWALLRFQRQPSAKNLTIGSVGVATLAASHHLVVLALVMAVALLFSIILRKGYHVLRTARPGLVMKATQLGFVRWAGFTAALVVGVGFHRNKRPPPVQHRGTLKRGQLAGGALQFGCQHHSQRRSGCPDGDCRSPIHPLDENRCRTRVFRDCRTDCTRTDIAVQGLHGLLHPSIPFCICGVRLPWHVDPSTCPPAGPEGLGPWSLRGDSGDFGNNS